MSNLSSLDYTMSQGGILVGLGGLLIRNSGELLKAGANEFVQTVEFLVEGGIHHYTGGIYSPDFDTSRFQFSYVDPSATMSVQAAGLIGGPSLVTGAVRGVKTIARNGDEIIAFGKSFARNIDGGVPIGQSQETVMVNPKSLLSRQSRQEMTGSRVKSLSKKMIRDGYDTTKDPIEIAIIDGKKVIIDGHHRTKAAIRAGITEVPVIIKSISRSLENEYMQSVAEVLAGWY